MIHTLTTSKKSSTLGGVWHERKKATKKSSVERHTIMGFHPEKVIMGCNSGAECSLEGQHPGI